jgi:hypothetical protein
MHGYQYNQKTLQFCFNAKNCIIYNVYCILFLLFNIFVVQHFCCSTFFEFREMGYIKKIWTIKSMQTEVASTDSAYNQSTFI